MALQLKPYLDIRSMGSSLQVGSVPPSAVEIEDPPEYLAPLLAHLREECDEGDALTFLAGYGLDPTVAKDLLEQLADAGLIGPPIPATNRYARHLLYYDSIGADYLAAQHRISRATVAIIGTGGIGSNVATILAAAGVGRLKITDGDTVELSNLTRQYLYTETDVDRVKVIAAKERLGQLNSSITIETYPEPASPQLIAEVIAEADVVVMSADRPEEIRLWIDDASRELKVPYLIAGYVDSVGCIGPLVLPGLNACGMCAIAESARSQNVPIADLLGPNLNATKQAGSYGPLNSLVSSVAANEVLRFLAGLSCETASGRLLLDSRNYELSREMFPRDKECSYCGNIQAPVDDRWSTAVHHLELESVYEFDRSTASINRFVCDPDLAEVIERVVHTASLPKDALQALDFGCGTGEVTQLIARAGYHVLGVDQSVTMVDTAVRHPASWPAALQSRVSYAPINGPIVEADAYDLIVCCNVLDHIEDAAPILNSFRAGLREGGTVVITVPHPLKDGGYWIKSTTGNDCSYHEFRLRDYFDEGAISKHREDANGNIAIAGIRTFHRTVATYSQLFTEAGFAITEIREPQPNSTVAQDQPVIWAKTSRVPYFITFVLSGTSRTADHIDAGKKSKRQST